MISLKRRKFLRLGIFSSTVLKGRKIILGWFKLPYSKTITATVAVVIFLLVITNSPDQTQIKRLDWGEVKEGTLYIELVEAGEIEAISQISISAPMLWTDKLQIIELIEEGKSVKQGDLIVQFDDTDLREELQLEQEALTSSKADLNRIKAQQAFRISELENQAKIAQYSYDQARLTLEAQQFESEAKKEDARIELRKSEIDLEKIKTQLDAQKIIHASESVQYENKIRQSDQKIVTLNSEINKLKIVAPSDGIVVYHEVGGWDSRERLRLGSSIRPGETLISIPDLSQLQVKCFVNEVDRPKLTEGQPVQITLEAYPEVSLMGYIAHVARLAQTFENNSQIKGFEIRITLHKTNPKLKPGMTAKTYIRLDSLEDVRYVPLGCVFEIDGTPVVFKKGSDKPFEVDLGDKNEQFIELHSNLKTGTKLSWVSPIPEARPLGAMVEQEKINSIRENLLASFNEFENRGILYNYLSKGEPVDSLKMSGRRSDRHPRFSGPDSLRWKNRPDSLRWRNFPDSLRRRIIPDSLRQRIRMQRDRNQQFPGRMRDSNSSQSERSQNRAQNQIGRD